MGIVRTKTPSLSSLMLLLLLTLISNNYFILFVKGNSSFSSSSSSSSSYSSSHNKIKKQQENKKHDDKTSSSRSRAYPLGCSKESISYYDYDNYNPILIPQSSSSSSSASKSNDDNNNILKQYNHNNFIIIKRLGSGKFSDVYEALTITKNNDNNEAESDENKVAIKCLKPVSIKKIKRELLILSHVSKLPNLTRLLGILCITPEEDNDGDEYDSSSDNITLSTLFNEDDNHNNQHHQHQQIVPALVLEHAGLHSHWFSHGGSLHHHNNHNDPNTNNKDDYYLSMYEIKYYLYNLLIALDALHSHGIMHRDVKPRNILITRIPKNKRSLVLVDLGLADFYLPNKYYNVRVASRHYKAPELLINYPYYDYSIDMWSVGCILASLLFQMKEPFFKGNNNIEQFYTIVSILGIDDFILYYNRYLKGKMLKKYENNSNADYPKYELDSDMYNNIMNKKHYSLLLLPNKRKSWMALFLQRQKQQQEEQLLNNQQNINDDTINEHNSHINGNNNKNNDNICHDDTTTTINNKHNNKKKKKKIKRNKNDKSNLTKKTSTTSTTTNNNNNKYFNMKELKNGFDLLDKLLIYNHLKRYTAKEALQHSFFDDVRDNNNNERMI